MNKMLIEENDLLFGFDRTPRIVAAELAGRFVRFFFRRNDRVVFRDDPFHPFILLDEASLLNGFASSYQVERLAGTDGYRYMATFRDWQQAVAAKTFLARRSGKTPSVSDAPYFFISDPVHQHLLRTGKTLFKDLQFSELQRVSLDIETYCEDSKGFSNPDREKDCIISIAVAGSDGFSRVLSGDRMDEREMLAALSAIIRERDPDVIEGHNLFRFDLEYIRKRAARHQVKLAWGRDGSEPKFSPSRFTIAERIIDYTRCNIYGRQIVDTYFLLQQYDVGTRELENHSLKTAAKHFGLSSTDRTYLDGSKISEVFHQDVELLRKYNLDDARETLALSERLSYPFFLQTRIFPYTYQNCPVRGNATKINSLFLREYLRQGQAIPHRPGSAEEFEGGYADILKEGVVGPVVHCDVASLYPSLLLSYRITPANDRLELFLPLLNDLRNFRLWAKGRAKSESDQALRQYYDALQQAFKILINSFYGYLGATIHNFSDPTAAAQVTRLGRETIREMISWLMQRGAEPVEIDTDGIYFIPPAEKRSTDEGAALVAELSASLRQGIDVELDGSYDSMFSYKVKNYALLCRDGTILIKGSGLKSRGMEKYLRHFLREMIRLLVQHREHEVEALYQEYVHKLTSHSFPIRYLARSETLSESSTKYLEKVRLGRRHQSAAYEIALQTLGEFRAGETISYYVCGHGKGVTAYENCHALRDYDEKHPDENVPFYLEKLRLLKKKFHRFLPSEPSLFD